MALSSKRGREPLSPLQGCSSLRQLNGKRNGYERDQKSLKLMQDEKSRTCDRRWEDMNHEILIFIMKRYRWYEWHESPDFNFIICKSWLSAFLDVLFPSGDVLDLRRLLDDHVNFGYAIDGSGGGYTPYAQKIRRFYIYLRLNFERRSPNHYTKLILSECILHEQAHHYIAQQLPALKSVVCPAKMTSFRDCFDLELPHRYVCSIMFKYWKNLEDAHCQFEMVSNLAAWCKSIRNLTVTGVSDYRYWLPDNIALVLANGFPLLDRLSISSFVFSFTAMSMILDCHKNLSYLDMTHTLCVPDEVMLRQGFNQTTLDYLLPKDLSDKIASVQTVLTCDRKNCPGCSLLDLRCW